MESEVGSGFYVKKVREDLSGEAMSKLKERSEEERGPNDEKKQSLCHSPAEGKHLATSSDRGRWRGRSADEDKEASVGRHRPNRTQETALL